MKRKRNEPTKILTGTSVEVQLEDGKWHSGVIVECQTRKSLVQVEQEQFWIESELIRPNAAMDQKRNVSFEYRPGQFLRNETKASTNKIVPDEQTGESSQDSKKKRSNRASFVWKPSTTSTIQTRRSSKSTAIVPEENALGEAIPNSEQSSEVLIFRPVIRFVQSSTSPKRHCSTDDENLFTTTASTDSRSSSTTSTDNPFPLDQALKSEPKPACFLETPPPSLPDIHLAQDSDGNLDKPCKSKRKQDRPQRKPIEHDLFKEKNTDELLKPACETCDPGYLSDEYSEPNPAHENLLTCAELQKYAQYLDEDLESKPSSNERISQELVQYLGSNAGNYQKLEDYRRQSYQRKKSATSKSKRLHNLKAKSKRLPANPELLIPSEQHALLSPASPLTPLSAKLPEQSPAGHLLSPNVTEQLPALAKERDVYEIIHCLCHCEIDNGFMIQCETCLCWSHCECVGVTANCIPAFFKCSLCSKAEAERASQWTCATIFAEESTALLLSNSTNAEKVALLLSYGKRLWNLREQMVELKLRSTPMVRSMQCALRSDDLKALFPAGSVQADELIGKMEERQSKREYYQTVAQTIDQLVDSVCSSLSTSACLSLDFSQPSPSPVPRVNEQMELLITHLCDDEPTRQRRLTIENRYERLLANIDEQLQSILLEHQTVQTQLAFEFGIIPLDLAEEALSYDAYESALRSAIDRLKC